ncbi:MAG TPA: glycoside hydrolase domain-containing protein [Trebonia sp.]|nr:glycoside hydrolase domain-containing protein [Trebonia sp.]
MRGAVALIIGGGLLLGSPGTPVRPGTAVPAGTRTVVYDGYEISVPAGWPVYRLDTEPQQCVRYDRHAVYLGVPSANQQCPAGLIGRTETVSILPVASYGPSATTLRFTAATGTLPQSRGVVMQDSSEQVLQVTPLAGQSVTVTATYGSDLALARRLLASLRPAPAGTPWTAASAGTGPETSVAAVASMPSVSPTGPPEPAQGALQVSPSLPGPPTPVTLPAPERVRPPRRPQFGFDTCSVPSQAALRAWRRRFSVVAVYIGGVNAACYDGNLSAAWIHRAAGLGWSMLPTYVGPQAPCYGYGLRIRPGQAAREGRSAADDAAWDAWRLGLPGGSPIYYDMEAYRYRSRSCTTAVLSFLGSWTREINAKGYTSGVYSSLDACILDLQWNAIARRQGFRPPQALWYALWDNRYELNDTRLRWPMGQRAKQYRGPHNLTVGGITLNIDTDFVDSPTAR